jgi:pyrroline-5-carboxylate reductase
MEAGEHLASSLHVLIVGCGNMGYALLTGWLKGSGGIKVHAIDPVAALRDRAMAMGATASQDVSDMPVGFFPAVVVLAVKPQQLCALLPAYRGLAEIGALFLSVAAGIDIQAMASALGTAAPIIRCMPNTPVAVGAGMLVCCPGESCGEKERLLATKLLSPAGKVAFVEDEALMDVVTAVSGSGPAYVFHFIDCLERAAITEGLPAALARDLALQTVHGAGLLASLSDRDPAMLRRDVTSPNGTTAAALAVLMGEAGLDPIVARAVEAARARSIELGKG